MDALNAAIVEFVRAMNGQPCPPEMPTRDVLTALRLYLNEVLPGWRESVFESAGGGGVEVEFHLAGGRVVRGTLIQRPSAVTGEET